MRADLEALVAAGLYDPDAPDADDTRELLEYLLERGVTVEEMLLAEADDRLPAALGMRAFRSHGPRFPVEEAAELAGLDVEVVEAILAAAGFPPLPHASPAFDDGDVEMLRVFRAGEQLLGRDRVLQLVRVMGAATASVAEAGVAAYLTEVEAPLVRSGASRAQQAESVSGAMAAFAALPAALASIFRRHADLAILRSIATRLDPGRGDTLQVAVGFVDLVGSTGLARALPRAHLDTALARFEAATVARVAAAGGRVVKHVGDGAMFVVGAAVAACEVALDLLDHVAGEAHLRGARAGVAHGEVSWRDGDYYGPVVNLAARAVDVAPAGGLLAAEGVAAALDGSPLRVEPTGPWDLKGFDEPVRLWRVVRPGVPA